MEKRFSGKNVLVTGSSRGIGRAIAEEFAQEGAHVIINFINGKQAADEAVSAIVQAGGKAVAIQADVSKVADIERLFDEAEKHIGKLDVVVANSATFMMKPFIEVTEADYDTVFNLNTKGTFFVMREAARRVNDGGRIIVTSTGGVKIIMPGNALYLGSKGGIEQLVRTLAQELGQRNITVNAILPGHTDTSLLPAEFRKMAAEASPFKRVGEPKDIADVTLFLASEAARWITGQEIGVGGGVF